MKKRHSAGQIVGFQYNQWWYSCQAGVVLYLLDFVEHAPGKP